MSRLLKLGQAASGAGVTLGLAATGAAVGFVAERYVAGRSLRGDDAYADEPLGALRGSPHVVHTDDGAQLHVEVDEAPNADVTVVFIHGYALTQDSWHFQRRDLRGRARLVFWDQRSHGRSSRAPDGLLSFDRLARDLGQVLDEVVPEGPVVLVGHSMGGMTLLALATQRPELFGDRIAGVGLLATSPWDLSRTTLGLPGPAGRFVHRLAPGVVAGLARRPELVERGRMAASDLGYVLTRRYAFGTGSSPALVAFTSRLNAATPVDVLAALLPQFSTADYTAAVPVLDGLPVLVVAADHDLLIPVEHGRDLAAALPNSTYVEVEQAGHMVVLERHEVVTEHLDDLIQKIRANIQAGSRRRGRLSRKKRQRRGPAS